MFFKSITLPSNHWSWRLLHFVLPSVRRYNNFCPHFWLTILAMFLYIPVLIKKVLLFLIDKLINLFKLIIKPVSLLFDIIEKFFTDKKIKSDLRLRAKYENEWNKLSVDEKLLAIEAYNSAITKKFFNNISPVEKCFKKKIIYYIDMLNLARKYDFFYNLNSMDTLQSPEMYRKRMDTLEKALKKHTIKKPEPKNLRTKAEITELQIKWAKIGVTLLISMLLSIITFIVYKVIMNITLFLKWISLVINWLWLAILWCFYGCGYVIYWVQYFITKNSTIFIILAIFLSIIGFLIKFPSVLPIISRKLFPKGVFDYLRCIAWERKIISVKKFVLLLMLPIGKFLGIIMKLVKDIFKFLWLGIKTFKADNCPELIWEEKKIENEI